MVYPWRISCNIELTLKDGVDVDGLWIAREDKCAMKGLAKNDRPRRGDEVR